MLAYADHEFAMGVPQSDGAPLRAHFLSQLRSPVASPREIAEAELKLAPPACPREVMYVLEWYSDIAERRPNMGMGLCSIPWTEIEAWSNVAGTAPLSTWEYRALNGIEALFIKHNRKKD